MLKSAKNHIIERKEEKRIFDFFYPIYRVERNSKEFTGYLFFNEQILVWKKLKNSKFIIHQENCKKCGRSFKTFTDSCLNKCYFNEFICIEVNDYIFIRNDKDCDKSNLYDFSNYLAKLYFQKFKNISCNKFKQKFTVIEV